MKRKSLKRTRKINKKSIRRQSKKTTKKSKKRLTKSKKSKKRLTKQKGGGPFGHTNPLKQQKGIPEPKSPCYSILSKINSMKKTKRLSEISEDTCKEVIKNPENKKKLTNCKLGECGALMDEMIKNLPENKPILQRRGAITHKDIKYNQDYIQKGGLPNAAAARHANIRSQAKRAKVKNNSNESNGNCISASEYIKNKAKCDKDESCIRKIGKQCE